MSARSHVDVNERRLRPIYDCLDNGNNKKALQEADKVLKKQKDLLCAKVLKALALLRLGRHDESMQLLQDVHAQSPSEESTLLAMGIAYRELHKLDLIADMYENAHKEKPDNEEVLSALFMAYVRLSNYKKQQQTAMKLHRLKPNKNPYYFWAVMSIVMQAHMDKKLAKTMYLPLAERMASKYVAENKIEAEAEVQMYLIVLEELNKYEEALEVVTGPLGEKLGSDPRFQKAKEAELLIKLERWSDANKAYKNMLKDNADDWAYIKGYFKTAFAMIDSKWTPCEENGGEDCEADYTVERVVRFLEVQLELAATMTYTPRGPFLARMELLLNLKQRQIPAPESIESGEALIRGYLAKFGDRPSCFADLKLFLDLITPEQAQKIIDDLTTELGLNSPSEDLCLAQDAKSLQRHLCLLQLTHSCGLHDKLSTEEKLSLSQQLIRRYRAGLSLGEDLRSTDLQYSDNYLVLASHLMVEVYLANGDRAVLWQAIVLLEKALKSSPSNFQIKLVLIRFYSLLGSVGPCLMLYESMEVKYIQNDSLGYTVVNHLSRLGHFSAAASIYGAMLRFFTVNHKDTTEYLTASYKFGSFTKIYEFVLFRERLQNSLQFASATAERMMLDLTQETSSHQVTERMLSYMEIDPVKDTTEWEELRDNRDLHVMLNWNPPHKTLTEAHCQQSFREEVAWLKVRNLILRILAASVALGQHAGPNNNSVGNGEAGQTSMSDVLQGLITELRKHVADCEASLPTLEYPVCGPSSTRLTSYIKGQYANSLLSTLDTLFYVHSLREGGLEKADKAQEEKMETLCKELKGHVTEACERVLTKNKDATTFTPAGLEGIVHTAELLSHVTIIIGACQRMLKPLKSSIAKRNKKKKDNPPPLPPTFGHFNGLVQGLVDVAKTADDTLTAADVDLLSQHLESMKFTQFDSEEDEQLEQALRSNVRLSYEQSIRDVHHLIDMKKAYLSALHL